MKNTVNPVRKFVGNFRPLSNRFRGFPAFTTIQGSLLSNGVKTFRPARGCRHGPSRVLVIFCLLLASLICQTGLINTANAATYYLDDANGLDTNPGTNEKPWKTLAKAQADVTDGDIVIVYDGSYGDYYEASVSRTDWVTYQAHTGHNPELKRIQINNQTVTRDTYLKFDGFTIRPDTDDNSALEVRRSLHTKFLNLNVIGRGARYTTRGFRVWDESSYVTVDNCTFSGGDKTGRFDGFAYVIHAPYASNLVITDNEISQFRYFGVYFSNNNNIIKNNHIHNFGGDGLMFGAGPGPLLIEDNEIHDLEIYYPTLQETPTETTWSVDGTTMTNPDANWGSASEPFNWPIAIEIVVVSGNNVNTGDNEVRVATVVSPTEIIFDDSISSGGQPSNVDYILRDQTHGDLMQHGISTIDSPNVTIRGNKLYDAGNGWSFMHLQVQNTTNPDRSIGGYNWLIENNLCWNSYENGQEEYGHPLNVRHIDGAVFRNNIVIGRVEIRYDEDVTLANNIVSYISVYGDSTFLVNDYNIFNRGGVNESYPVGEHTIFINPGYSWDEWNDPSFTDIFADYENGDFRHASATSLGVGHGDPANSPFSDILGVSRVFPPDAGCYEYVSSDPNNQPPVLDAIGNKFVDENAVLTFDVNATDADGDTITYSATGLPSGATVVGQTFSWTPSYEQAGTYPDVTFIARDTHYAQDSETITITVNNVNRPPVAVDDSATVAEDSGANAIDVLANDSDADGDTLTITAVTQPSHGSVVITGGGTGLTYTPAANYNGSDSFTYTVSDGNGGTDTATVNMTITSVPDTPVLDAIGNKLVNENSQLTFTASASDTDVPGNTLTFSLINAPAGASIDPVTGVFTWTPAESQGPGSYNVTVRVTDNGVGSLYNQETINITVNEINVAPVLGPIDDQTIDVGSQLTFTANATDADVPANGLTFSLSNAPAGASIDPVSGKFTWTPTEAQGPDSYDVTVRVTDDGAGNLYDEESMTITIVPDETDPTVTNLSPQADSIQAPLNTLVILDITDSGDGVDANSVTVKVNNNIVYTGNTNHYPSADGDCQRLGTKANYKFIYHQWKQNFDFDQPINVTVNATDLAGNVMNEYSYSFKTEMRSFGKNKQVDPHDVKKGRPATVSDNNGDIWAVWHAGVTGSRDIYIGKLLVDEEYFDSSVQLTSDAAECNPVTATGSDGKLYVAWQDNRRGNWDIYISTSNDWSAEIRVTDSNDNQINPAIVVDSSLPNNVYIVWEDDRNGNQDIYVATSSNGFATKTVSQITSDASDQVEPAIAADSDNTIYVVWTDTRNGGKKDIYGAASNNGLWTNIPVVAEEESQSSPAIAAEAVGSILHLVWVDDRTTDGDDDIFYAKTTGGLTPLTGSSIIDDNTGADQISPVIITTGSTEGDDLKVFACWRDERNADADLYFAEISSEGDYGTNVFVGDEGTSTDQSEPAIGIDGHGHPYLVWTNERTDICYAGSTFITPDALASENVSITSEATVGTMRNAIQSVDDVSAEVPQGAYLCDVKVTISRIRNPQKPPANNRTFLYEFGPSGTTFSKPVTITIPYNATTLVSSPSAYWYNPLTGLYSQEGITDVEVIQISSGLYALRFKTTHFSIFGGGGSFDDIFGGGGGGGGCSMSPNSQDSIAELLLPYIGLAVAMVVLKLRNRRKRKAHNITKSEC